jgi:glutathione S-transferase
VDNQIAPGEPGTDSYKALWTAEKKVLLEVGDNFPFVNLPYLEHKSLPFTLSQSDAILRYVGILHPELEGKTTTEKARANLCISQMIDIASNYVRAAYGGWDNPEIREKMTTKRFPADLKQLSVYLGLRNFVAGDTVTLGDCKFYEGLYVLQSMVPGIIKEANLLAYMQRFEAIPSIAEYISSTNYKSLPFNNPHAQWSGPPVSK